MSSARRRARLGTVQAKDWAGRVRGSLRDAFRTVPLQKEGYVDTGKIRNIQLFHIDSSSSLKASFGSVGLGVAPETRRASAPESRAAGMQPA